MVRAAQRGDGGAEQAAGAKTLGGREPGPERLGKGHGTCMWDHAGVGQDES